MIQVDSVPKLDFQDTANINVVLMWEEDKGMTAFPD